MEEMRVLARVIDSLIPGKEKITNVELSEIKPGHDAESGIHWVHIDNVF